MACESCPEIQRTIAYSSDGAGLGIILGLLGLTFVAYYLSRKK